MTSTQFQSLLNRNRTGHLDKLQKAVTATPGQQNRDDEGYWRLTTDKSKNGIAVIRFLPAPPPEELPFVSFYRHAFKGPNGWYIEMSRTSIDEADPLTEYNSRLWNTNDKAKQDQVRKQSRKLTYVSNILVISDKAKPENEGKVFLFRYGKKIFDKLQKAVNPEFEGDTPFDPWDFFSGANFRLRQKDQAGFPNYDDSMFEAPRPLFDGDEDRLLAVAKDLKSLHDIITPDKFKSYDDLKKRLNRVFGFDTSAYLTPAEAAVSGSPRTMDPVAVGDESYVPAPVGQVAKQWVAPNIDDDEDEDEDLSRFDD